MAKSTPERAATSPPTCIVCGYDLRAHPAEGKCPECGTAVERSLHGYWLRYSDQRWVETMLRGLNWIWMGMGVLVGVVLLVCVCGEILFVSDPTAVHPAIDLLLYASLIAIALGSVAACLGILGGLWMFTVPEPRREGSEPHRTVALRLLTIALVPAFGCIIPGIFPLGSAAAGMVWWQFVLPMVGSLSIGAQAVLLLDHARLIERRCSGFEEAREKHLRAYRRTILQFAIGLTLLAVCGLGVIISLPWLAAIGQLGETRKRIGAELAISSAEERIGAVHAT